MRITGTAWSADFDLGVGHKICILLEPAGDAALPVGGTVSAVMGAAVPTGR